MSNLPYFIPDDELELNLALLMIILYYLAKTKHGKLTVNNERLLLYMYLLKNPLVLNEILIRMNKGRIELSDTEYFSVESISINIDSLFNTSWIKELLQYASSKNYLTITYKKADGFVYALSDNAKEVVNLFTGNYFNKLKQHTIEMQKIQSEPISKLNNILNTLFSGNMI